MMYNTVLSLFFLIPVMLLSGEHAIIRDHEAAKSTAFWVTMVITGFFGFLINIAIFLQIKHTSPLTHNLSGTAKVHTQALSH